MKTFLILFTFNINHVLGPTPSIQERIAILKSKLLDDGHADHPTIFNYYDDTSDDYENHDFVIEPITRNRAYKKSKTQMTTISNVTTKTNSPAKRQGLRPFLKSQANKKKRDKLFLNPMDIFYRRAIVKQMKDENLRWVLCQDIITPFLTGAKKSFTEMTKVGIKDATPERMFHLLSINMSVYAKEDVFALMYQISQHKIRLYQWDVMPIRVLINLLVKGKSHTFRNLKASMREMFENWHLDFRNLTKIIEQTRIIRPACTITSQYTGSTKTAKGSRYKEFMTTTIKTNK